MFAYRIWRCLIFSLLLVAQTVAISCAKAQPSKTEQIPMRDGTKLATDVYLPAGKGPHPTILIRTPYSKKSNSAIAENLPCGSAP